MTTSVLRYAAMIAMLRVASTPALCEEVNSNFSSLFNGNNLDGCDGDPRFRQVKDGAIVGQTTKENLAEQNTFLIYRAGQFSDFDLRFSYKVAGYNSGV